MLKDEDRTKCSIYSRVMGYFQPTNMWNIGKKGEWEDRHSAFFSEEKAMKRIKEIENGTD